MNKQASSSSAPQLQDGNVLCAIHTRPPIIAPFCVYVGQLTRVTRGALQLMMPIFFLPVQNNNKIMHLARLMANPATFQDFPSTLFYVITDILKIFIKKKKKSFPQTQFLHGIKKKSTRWQRVHRNYAHLQRLPHGSTLLSI